MRSRQFVVSPVWVVTVACPTSTPRCCARADRLRRESAEQIAAADCEMRRGEMLMTRTRAAVDAASIAMPTPCTTTGVWCEPEVRQTSQRSGRCAGMNARIGPNATLVPVRCVRDAAEKGSNVIEAGGLLHGPAISGFTDAGCQCPGQGADAKDGVNCHATLVPDKPRTSDVAPSTNSRRSHRSTSRLREGSRWPDGEGVRQCEAASSRRQSVASARSLGSRMK